MMDHELYTLAYFSRNAIRPCGDMTAEIDRILRAARLSNAARGITGALLYSDGCFGQVLEGPLSEVEAIFEKIQVDRRHRDVKVLHFMPIDNRSFGDWAMAFAGAPNAAAFPLNIPGVLGNSNDIESAEAGQMLVELLSDLIEKHELHRL